MSQEIEENERKREFFPHAAQMVLIEYSKKLEVAECLRQ